MMMIKGLALFLLVLLLCGPAATAGPRPAYLDTIPVFWRNLYPDGGHSLYCGRSFAAGERSVNIEHVFPMSWVTRALGCGSRKQCRAGSPLFNRIESDMHNLYPALANINKARGAMPYAEISGERWASPGCDFELDPLARRVEPRPAVRGDIARAMFYMADKYGLEIYRRQRLMLLDWHRADPPDDHERERNDVIEGLQGGRNRFIDRPESLR